METGKYPKGKFKLDSYYMGPRKAARTTAALLASPKGFGCSPVQRIFTARLLGNIARWKYSIVETLTAYSGKYVSRKHTVQTLAETWKKLKRGIS